MTSLKQIARTTNAAWATPPAGGARVITTLVVDSRSPVPHPETALFIALPGRHRSGIQFVQAAYAKGIRAFLIQELLPAAHALPADATVLVVPDAIAALQLIAAARRQEFEGQVVGITGSNGKTIVKEWLYELVSPDRPTIRSPKSYNSQTGVPLSVWLLEPEYEVALFEAGISTTGEMDRLERVIQPHIGIFTTLGPAHESGFASDKEKGKEKAKLFRHTQKVVACADHPLVMEALETVQQQRLAAGGPLLQIESWSATGKDAVWQVGEVRIAGGETLFTISGGGLHYELRVPFTDSASRENAVHSWVAALLLGITPKAATARLAHLQPIAMRLEMRRGVRNCTLIDDAYNSDLTSLRIALELLQQQRQHPVHTVILSDILQSGRDSKTLYADVAALLQAAGIQKLIGVGYELEAHQALFSRLPQTQFFPHTEALAAAIPELRFRDEAILIKGARRFAFERIVALMEQEVHRTVLTINLKTLVENLAAYRRLLAPGVRTMAMVKAFSYGSGSHEIAAALQSAGIDYLAVAYTDEGVVMREKGITLPVMVMSPDVGSFERLIAWRLEPEIYSFHSLSAFVAAAQSLGVRDYPIHIKLDTGMHRLGFSAGEMAQLNAELANAGEVRVQSVFSHLAGSEAAGLDAFTAAQATAFEAMSRALTAPLPATPKPLLHLCNSAGITRHTNLHYDMVRLGLGLYGLDSSGILRGRIAPVSALHTTIAQLRTVPAGEGVGYGAGSAAGKDRLIATVCVGYADGYPRALGNGVGHMLVAGQAAPTVGSICMDLCMIDVTGIAGVQEGDRVTVFGEGLSIKVLAGWSGTIPYEIMTGISQRVKRVYVEE